MANGGRASKGLRMGKTACRHAARARLEAAKRAIEADKPDSPHANSARRTRGGESDSGLFSVNNYDARRAVDEPRFACGWTPGAVARIPQITSLDPADPA
jgi:hypothetical protein